MPDDQICPECGRRVPDSMTVRRPDEEFCTPLTCSAWVVVGKFDHATRTWRDDAGEIIDPNEVGSSNGG